MSTEVASLIASLRADNSQFDSAYQSSAQAVQGFSDSAEKSGGVASALGSALTAAATAATATFVAGLGAAAMAAKNFLDQTSLANVSLQGFGETGTQAAANIDMVVKSAANLGVPQQQLLKTSELLQAASGGAINTAETLKAMAGAAETTGTPIAMLTSQLGLLYQMFAQGDTAGANMVGRMLVREQVIPQQAFDQMSAMTKQGTDINQIWSVVMENLRGGSKAAEQYAGTLAGVTQSAKNLFGQDSAMVFKPLYDEAIKLGTAIKGALEDPALQQVLAGLGQSLAGVIPNIDHLVSSISGLATAGGLKSMIDDVKTLAPLLGSLGGAGLAGGLGELGKIPIVGSLIPDVAPAIGALAGFLAVNKDTREAVMSLIGAVGQLAMALSPIVGLLSALLGAAAPVAAVIINAAAAIVSFVASSRPLLDILSGVIVAFLAFSAVEKIIGVMGAVGAAFEAAATKMLYFTTKEASINEIGTTGIVGLEGAMASLNTAVEANIAATETQLATATQATAAYLTQEQALNAVSVAALNYAKAEAAAEEAGVGNIETTVALTRANLALGAAEAKAQEAMAGFNAALTAKTEATAAATSADTGLTAAEGELAAQLAITNAEEDAAGFSLSAMLGPIGLVIAAVGLLAMAFDGMGRSASAAAAAQRASQEAMASFNKNEPGSNNNYDLLGARDQAARDVVAQDTAKRDALQKQLTDLTKNTDNIPLVGGFTASLNSMLGGDDVSGMKQKISDLNSEITKYSDISNQASQSSANMLNFLHQAMAVTGASYDTLQAAAQKANIDLTLDPGSSQGMANLAKLQGLLGSTAAAADAAVPSITRVAAEFTHLALVMSGKDGSQTFTVGTNQISDLQGAIAKAKANGAPPDLLAGAQDALNGLSGIAGQSQETKQYADHVMKLGQEQQKATSLAHGLVTANEALQHSYQSLANAHESYQHALESLANAQQSYQNSLISLINAQETAADASETLAHAQADAQAALNNMHDALNGINNKYWDLVKTLNELNPDQAAFGAQVAAQVAVVNNLQTSYDALNLTYTQMSQGLLILTDQQKTFQDILAAPLQGTSKYDSLIHQNQMSQDSIKANIDALELQGVPTKDQRIVDFTNQLDRLKLVGDQLNLQKSLDIGDKQFQLQQLQNTMTEITFTQAITAAQNLGTLNAQIGTTKSQMDIAKISVDLAKNALDDQNRTVGITVAALQNLASTNNQVKSAQDSMASSAQGVISASQGVEHAQQGVTSAMQGVEHAAQGIQSAEQGVQNALYGVQNAQNSMAQNTLSNNAAMAASYGQYAQDAAKALQALAAYESSTDLVRTQNAWVMAGVNAAAIAGNVVSAAFSTPLPPHIGGYAVGGYVEAQQLAYVAESGPELILPLTDPSRSHQLIQQYAPNLMVDFGTGPPISSSGGSNSNGGFVVQSGAVQVNITVPPGLSIPPELLDEINYSVQATLEELVSTYQGIK